ncbi:MAG: glycosyltransferase, partial [Chloroflexi bacterium]|nr:glycosyltransferase [Chloroflexota bacterium]
TERSPFRRRHFQGSGRVRAGATMTPMKTAEEPAEASADGPLDVSVIIPCLNEEIAVGECVTEAREWLSGSGFSGEVLVVDNASTDGTAKVAREAGARVITELRRGKGNAFRTGVRESRGRFIVMSDGDGTYNLSDLDPVVRPLEDGYDMVIGNRLKGEMESQAMPWLHRRVGNPMFSTLISVITRRSFGDVLSGLRSFTREAWETISPAATGFELESEICLRAGRNGMRVAEVPIPYGVRREPSKLRGLTHGWAIARFIILESADLIFIYPGIIAIVLGIVSLAMGVAFSDGVDVGSVSWQPVFAGGILVPGGVAFLTLGIATKWLAWRRDVARSGRVVNALRDESIPVGDYFLLAGVVSLVAGIGLDAYLLWQWAVDSPVSLALGWGAVAQTLVVSGLNLIVAAVLIGVLRAGQRSDEN